MFKNLLRKKDQWTLLYERLFDCGAIRIDDTHGGKLYSAHLNPRDNVNIDERVVNDIADLLYMRLCGLNVQFDTIASIPTGGDSYAIALSERMLARKAVRVLYASNDRLEIRDREIRHVVLVDDVLVHGSAVTEAIAVLATRGITAVAALFVSNLERNGDHVLSTRYRLPHASVFAASELRARGML